MGNEGNDTSAATRSPHSPHSPLDITTIPLDDPATYKLFARGATAAAFQFESRGMRELLQRAQPARFEDLIALNSLSRTGTMDLIPDLIDAQPGRPAATNPHQHLRASLAAHHGVEMPHNTR